MAERKTKTGLSENWFRPKFESHLRIETDLEVETHTEGLMRKNYFNHDRWMDGTINYRDRL